MLYVGGLTFETYLSQAEDTAEFILAAVNDGCNIICQYEYGYCRSAACAAAILEYYDRQFRNNNFLGLPLLSESVGIQQDTAGTSGDWGLILKTYIHFLPSI